MTDEKKYTVDSSSKKYDLVTREEYDRVKTELAEVKRLLQELYSPTQRYSDRVISGYWRQRLERFVK